MKRIHLFEFHDLAWYPQSWRNCITDVMRFFATRFDVFSPIVPRLKQALERLDCHDIIDLGSGSAGPVLLIQRQLDTQENYPVTITLTDKFPNTAAFRNAVAQSHGKAAASESSVDAMDVPRSLTGFRTMFTAFHHFPPEAARDLLRDAVVKRAGIGVFEYTERSLAWFVSLLFLPLFGWVTVPFMRPFSFERLLWTYVLPAPLLFGIWDGMASCLRTYSPKELEELVEAIDCRDYAWEIGQVRSFGACRITYLFGYPTKPRRVSTFSA
jgi:hypothetical protein